MFCYVISKITTVLLNFKMNPAFFAIFEKKNQNKLFSNLYKGFPFEYSIKWF